MRFVMFIFSLFPVISFAGNGSEQLFGNWESVYINGKFGKDSPWLYYGDLSGRFTQTNPDHNGGQGYTIGGVVTHDAIGYRIDKHNAIHIGYAYQYSQTPYSKKYTNENRAWQQYTFNDKFVSWSYSLRSRLEERTVDIGDGTSIRFRQQAKANYFIDDHWSLIASEEFFVNLNDVDWGPVAGFDQNRGFVGFGYKFDDVYRTEIGYMNQYINRDLRYDLIDHQLSINLYIDVPN